MRNQYLVSYDIAHPKRLRLMYKKMCGFGDPIQYSVFLCPLSAKEKVLLRDVIRDLIHHQEDRVMVVDLGPVEGRGRECVEFVGRRMKLPQSGAVVV